MLWGVRAYPNIRNIEQNAPGIPLIGTQNSQKSAEKRRRRNLFLLVLHSIPGKAGMCFKDVGRRAMVTVSA